MRVLLLSMPNTFYGLDRGGGFPTWDWPPSPVTWIAVRLRLLIWCWSGVISANFYSDYSVISIPIWWDSVA